MSDSVKQSVLVVGVGGLGAPALMTLARGGAKLALVDADPVELSNLPRQIIYRDADRGQPKVAAAARWLAANAPGVEVVTHRLMLDSANAHALIAAATFVIDAVDNPTTKFLINDVCIETGTPFAYGGVLGMTGQTMTVVPGRTACLRCLFEEPPDADESASCRDAGIIGPVAGAIGITQAAEALRWLRGEALELAGQMLTYDGRRGRIRVTEIGRRPGCRCDWRAPDGARVLGS
ncbi:MAG TPA: HesA/MoeB/ThiF family protein [Candidatus Binataceae bacterium]|nr:HesA/MoeB/ThiF family protein [Candidatus Binataceae bacterium]